MYWLQDVLFNGPNIKEKTEAPRYDKIDTDLPVLYPRFPKSWILGFGMISGLIFAAGLFVPAFTFPFVDAPAITSSIVTVLVKQIMVIGASLLFSFFLIFLEERRLGTRDKDMVEEINILRTENLGPSIPTGSWTLENSSTRNSPPAPRIDVVHLQYPLSTE
ncbi:hypothetical protein [Halorubrum laminariae]|uniref:Uncharacterized protein n=1 Tax=Halorubrum laminariae TaxID=1433523 RepID=A0ABD6C5S8_9EURY|nr:hypothetical protein [Halorubrum laminariae]